MARKTWLMGIAGVLVVALAGLGYAQSVTRVTGGGQYATDRVGADNTLTFEVQVAESGDAIGQVEFDPTDSQTGDVIAAERWHGTVICATVDPDTRTAFFGGNLDARSSQDESGTFEIFLEDQQPPEDDDVIALERDGDPCDEQVAGQKTDLFRGEAQITTNGS